MHRELYWYTTLPHTRTILSDETILDVPDSQLATPAIGNITFIRDFRLYPAGQDDTCDLTLYVPRHVGI